MPGFEVELGELTNASDKLIGLSEKVRAAHHGIGNHEIAAPAESGGFDAFAIIDNITAPETLYGDQLGFDRIARAYEEHRQMIEDHLRWLAESTRATGEALARVADLYRRADQF